MPGAYLGKRAVGAAAGPGRASSRCASSGERAGRRARCPGEGEGAYLEGGKVRTSRIRRGLGGLGDVEFGFVEFFDVDVLVGDHAH